MANPKPDPLDCLWFGAALWLHCLGWVYRTAGKETTHDTVPE